jgi:hypothetical protein
MTASTEVVCRAMWVQYVWQLDIAALNTVSSSAWKSAACGLRQASRKGTFSCLIACANAPREMFSGDVNIMLLGNPLYANVAANHPYIDHMHLFRAGHMPVL